MGINDRDDDYRPRGQAPRRRGPYEGSDAPAGRSYQRGSRDDMPRGRSRDSDDDVSGSRGYSRRDNARYDDPRSSSGSRHERGAPDRSGYDRRPRPDQGASSGRRAREDWDVDTGMRRERRGADPYARGERSGRSQRPPVRDDWDSAGRPRGAPRGQSPADSGARGRRPAAAVAARGGLWGDEELMATGARRRAGLRDPRAARRGAQPAEEEAGSPAAAFGKAVLAIVLALVIGAGAAYGYYVISTPKLPANLGQPSSTPATGSIAAPQGQPLASAAYATASVTFVTAGPA